MKTRLSAVLLLSFVLPLAGCYHHHHDDYPPPPPCDPSHPCPHDQPGSGPCTPDHPCPQ